MALMSAIWETFMVMVLEGFRVDLKNWDYQLLGRMLGFHVHSIPGRHHMRTFTVSNINSQTLRLPSIKSQNSCNLERETVMKSTSSVLVWFMQQWCARSINYWTVQVDNSCAPIIWFCKGYDHWLWSIVGHAFDTLVVYYQRYYSRI